MTDSERRRLRVLAMSDRSWAEIEGCREDVQRISEHGPRDTEEDKLLVKIMLALVAAEMHMRAAEAIRVELGETTT